MRIALTHNLKLTDSVDEAEFDSPETIDAIDGALRRAGHEVERIEVSGPPSRVIARLEALQPDLIFNIAEGHKGKTREAFYPALFAELGIPWTGSDAHTLGVTLDKSVTKRVLTGYGVPTPRARLVTRETLDSGALDDVVYPVIVKPNFEGSSKGISAESVCDDAHQLAQLVDRELVRFESGLLVEHFEPGIDVACYFLDGVGAGGITSPIEVIIDPAYANAHNVFDYDLKHDHRQHVALRPAQLSRSTIEQIMTLTRRIVRALDIKDLGRCEFRVTRGARESIQFLEVDGLPSLEPGGGLFVASAALGLDFDGVIRAVLRSACKRLGLDKTGSSVAKKPKRSALRVGFTYNMKRGDDADAEAEFDSPKTIAAITAAIESYGHSVIALEANADLPHALTAAMPDVVFNIAEGLRGRGREAQVPALCELLGIPYSGSDPTTLSICLDKGLTKQMLRAARIDTPDWQLCTTGREKIKPFRYPVIVKPNAEGTSKGITSASVVADEAGARAAARNMVEKYGQPALIEEYIVGREFTVGLLGERRPKVLPPMEVIFVNPSKTPVYGFEEKQADTTKVRFECPAVLTSVELDRIKKVVRDTFTALGCRDVARVDLRMAPDGRVHVIEINPLPGLTPDFSDLCVIAARAGMDHRMLVGEILAGCIKRHREARAATVSLAPGSAPGPGLTPSPAPPPVVPMGGAAATFPPLPAPPREPR